MGQPNCARGSMIEALEPRQLLASVGGVDTLNMGKGDWIISVASAEANTGASSVQGLLDYEKSKGMKWLAVKAGDGNNFSSQFTTDLVTRAHNDGLKIFGYENVYGGQSNSGGVTTSQSGEKSNIDKIMAIKPDGLIFYAQAEWEKVASANSVAQSYGSYFKSRYSTKLLGYTTFAYAHLHPNFPFLGFGKYADVAMPQMFWKTLVIAGTPAQIIRDVDTDWKALYNGFASAGHSDSIKPIVPVGQGYDVSSANTTPGSQVTEFFADLKNDADPASPFGYNGVSFWNAQQHTPEIWLAIANGVSGAPTGSISGMVFSDVDGDGIRDVDETGLSGRTVYDDTNNDGQRELYEPFTKTDSNGNYKLTDMAARTHRIRQVLPGGSRQSFPSNMLSQTVALGAGQAAGDKNFGSTNLALINGTIFVDFDANGTKDTEDKTLAGWTVYVDSNQNGVLDKGEPSAVSTSAGTYAITVPAGSYRLREIPQTGFRITTPASTFYDFSVGDGETTVKFFGNTTNVLISGSVFNDPNANGSKDAGEGGLAGWRVFVDADGDGVFDASETSVLTDATGKYRLSIAPGSYRIQVLIPNGWAATIPGSAARKITLAGGGTTSNKNFGVRQIT